MAFIEKVCEVCGEHCGYSRKGYLNCHNSIQVCKTCRPLFRGVAHEMSWQGRLRGDGPIEFVLSVPSIPGSVSGQFSRWSYDKSDTMKKIRRLLRVNRVVMAAAPSHGATVGA